MILDEKKHCINITREVEVVIRLSIHTYLR